MGREIKFRAWDVTNADGPDMHYFNLGQAFSGMNGCPIMQYTGLQDKNGKEIHELDIIRWVDEETEDMVETPVFWDKGCFWAGDKTESCALFAINTCEVIGNTYENPKLLEN